MYIKYKNKEFFGLDDIRHKDLYNRYNNLKKVKEELLRKGVSVDDNSVYRNLFDRYDFYDLINKKIYQLINLYRKENLTEQIDKLNVKYKKKIDDIVESGNNHNRIHLFVRLFWSMSFFGEYFLFFIFIFNRNLLNGFKKGKRIN
jgi:hypothetical protein